ncbi:MAG TPA: hypothetical protein VGO55_00325 [Allosphingosinicella sp.]|jgi:hypothetical protein|nr:hypothetical protein [Allosphingosinicella sp.]
MRRALAMLALGGAAPVLAQGSAPALAPSPASPPVTDRERDSFGDAVSRNDLEAVRGVVGPYVLLFAGGLNFERSSPEALVEATRGCRLFEATRIGDDPAMWYLYACPGRPAATFAPGRIPASISSSGIIPPECSPPSGIRVRSRSGGRRAGRSRLPRRRRRPGVQIPDLAVVAPAAWG